MKDGAGFISDLRDAARQNPVSAALIGIGAIWWLTGRTGWRGAEWSTPDMSGVRDAARSAGDKAREWREGIAETGAQAWSRGSRTMADATEAATRAASTMQDQGASALSDARERLAELFEDQPLMLGVVGVAVGATIAAALPETELESAYLGEASDQVKSALSEMASAGMERASTAAGNAADAAMSEARRQGLTPDQIKATAKDIPSKLSRVAEAAGATLEN